METAGTTAEENRAVVLRYIEEVWNRHDLDAIDGFGSLEYINHAASTAEYRHGGARHAVGWLLSVFRDHRIEVEDVAADGETVAVRGRVQRHARGRAYGHRADGERFAVQQSHWFRVVDGKLAEHWAVRDDLGMMRQLGGYAHSIPPIHPPPE